MLTNPSTGCGNTTTNPLMDFHRNPWSDRPKHWTMQTWWNVNRESFTQLLPDISLYIWHAKHIWAVWLLGRRICFSGHNWFKVTKGFIVVEQQQQQQQQQQRQQQQQQQEQDFHKCRKKKQLHLQPIQDSIPFCTCFVKPPPRWASSVEKKHTQDSSPQTQTQHPLLGGSSHLVCR